MIPGRRDSGNTYDGHQLAAVRLTCTRCARVYDVTRWELHIVFVCRDCQPRFFTPPPDRSEPE